MTQCHEICSQYNYFMYNEINCQCLLSTSIVDNDLKTCKNGYLFANDIAYNYIGCYNDNISSNAFDIELLNRTYYSIKTCHEECLFMGYRYFGLSYSICYCGNEK